MIAGINTYPAYKASTVLGLSLLPEHWSAPRLKTVFREVDRRSGTGEEPLLSLRMQVGLVDHHEMGGKLIPSTSLTHYKVAEPGELVMNRMRAAAGLFGVPPKLGLVSPDYAVLRPRKALALDYFLHLFRTPLMMSAFRLESRGLGTGESGFLRLYTERFGMLSAPVPPPDEQAAIVRFLDHADRRIRRYIRAKQKLIKLLDEQKQAIINQAVTGGLAGPRVERSADEVIRSPNHIPWLFSMPAHWMVVRSKALFAPRKERAREGDEQLSATQAYGVIPQAEFERLVGRRVVKINLHLDKRSHVEKDDFVISMRSFQGGLERAWSSGCIRSSYVVLRPLAAVDVSFFGYLFKSRAYIQALQATGNFIRDGQDLNFNNFCQVDLPLVPLEEQRAISRQIDEQTAGIRRGAEVLRSEVELVREFRTRLVADVVTGQLDVRAAAAALRDEPADDEPVDTADEALDEEGGDTDATIVEDYT